MRRVAVLSNPQSGGNRNGSDPIQAVTRAAGLPHAEPGNLGELETALRDFAAAGIELLVVNGGDGTLGTVLTAMRNKRFFAREPAIAVLRGGTTNMVSGDATLTGRPETALQRLSRACRDGIPDRQIVTRRAIALQRDGDAEPTYGFFFATAMIPRAILWARSRLHTRGLTGPGGEALALAWLLSRLMVGRVEGDPVLRPDNVAYALDGSEWHEGQTVLFLATTLERLILGLRPVAADGGMGVAVLTWPYRRLWRTLPTLLTGTGRAPPESGLTRVNAQRMTVRTDTGCVLDGELFDADSATPLILRAADPVRFLVL